MSFSLEGDIVLLKCYKAANKQTLLRVCFHGPPLTSFLEPPLSLSPFSLSGPYPHLTMILKQLKMEGFMQSRWEHKHPESLKRLMGWLKEVSDCVS